jgi:hypothetical protein
MATIRKRGNNWQAIVRKGKATFARTFPSMIQAETWAASKEHELKAGAPLIPEEAPPTEVIVVCGGRTLRVSVLAWRDVMQAAGQMADDWQEHYGGLGRSQSRIDDGLAALNKLSAIAL